MKNIKTWLPVFPGFYGTIFEPDENYEIDCINDERSAKGLPDVEFDDIEFDYEGFNKNVSEACTGFIEHELSSVFRSKLVIEFEALNSPKFYNYSNDSIHITVKTSNAFLKELKKYIKDNIEAFKEYTKERYTSCSGFNSFYSNDANKWLTAYFDEIETNAHILGSLLEFVCQNEGIEQNDMYSFCNDVSAMYIEAKNWSELIEGVETATE